MDKGLYIDDLKPGGTFRNCVFAVRNVRIKPAGSAGPEATCLLSDKTGERKAKKWQASDEEKQLLCLSASVLASGTVDDKAGYEGELTLNAVAQAQLDSSLEAELVKPNPASKQFKSEFKRLRDSICDPNLHELVLRVFDSSTGHSFCSAVAAAKMHHAYPGGLLEHTVEVANMCDAVCSVLTFLDRDLLIACALIHDIGKLEEMEHGIRAGEYTAKGNLVGHVMLGSLRIVRAIDSITDFPPELKDQVLHLVISHHGVLEFGAIREPAFAEAFVLSECDLISAKVFECMDAKRKAFEGQLSVWSDALRRHVYVGKGYVEPVHADLKTDTAISSSPDNTTFVTKTAGRESLPLRAAMPLLGRVAAGAPGKSGEEIDEMREVELPPAGADYLLVVRGESMIDQGIKEGDLLFVRAQETASDGDIVVANLPGSGQTVKTLRRDPASRRTWLEAANPDRSNPDYAPIDLSDEAQIQGKVVGVLRTL